VAELRAAGKCDLGQGQPKHDARAYAGHNYANNIPAELRGETRLGSNRRDCDLARPGAIAADLTARPREFLDSMPEIEKGPTAREL
jgi:hypothetical protein